MLNVKSELSIWVGRVAIGALALAVGVSAGGACGGDDTQKTTTTTNTGGSGGAAVGGGGSTSSTGGSGGTTPVDSGDCSADGWCWSLPSPTGVSLDAVWRDPTDAAWVVGQHGTILRHDAKGWTAKTSGVVADLHAVYGSATNDVYAAGDAATLLHYDGTKWKSETLPVGADAGPPGAILALWAGKKSNVWAGGDSGALFHYDGSKWTREMSPTSFSIRAIIGSGSEVYLADDSGVVWAYDGATWSTALSTGRPAAALAFSAPSDVWFLTTNGGLYHSTDGMAWTPTSLPAGTYGALAIDGPRIWCGGDTAVVFDTSAMTPAPALVAAPDHGTFRAASPGGDGPLFVGDAGSVVGFSDGDQSWTSLASGDAANRLGIRGDSQGALSAIGDETVSLNGASWSIENTGTDRPLYAMAFDDAGDLWAAGTGGTVVRRQKGKWAAVDANTFSWLRGIWFGTSSGWIVGDKGLALTRFQAAWQPVATGTTQVLHAVHGVDDNAVWAVGDGGVILFWDGTSWKPELNNLPGDGVTASFRSVWARTKSDVWAVGGSGLILHYDGKKWSSVGDDAATYGLYSVWAASADDVYAVGTEATLLHYDGKKWRLQDSGAGGALNSVWGDGHGEVWVAGEGGAILHHHETP